MHTPDHDVRRAILSHLANGGHVTLFLDYDGTLVPIAPTPAEAMPDGGLLTLLTQLTQDTAVRTIILSGRPLSDLRRMLPVRGLILGGLYGVEMFINGDTVLREPEQDESQASLMQVREGWRRLSAGLAGFLLEDKGQAVALHARWADPDQAGRVLAAARSLASGLIHDGSFRILGGDRYVEVAPRTADKGQSVEWLLDGFPTDRDLPVAFGDDNKDEAGFAVIHGRGGYAIGVGHRYDLPGVDARLESPEDVRGWLRSFLSHK